MTDANDPTDQSPEVLRDQQFMRQALAQAHNAYAQGEVPVGAVVVCEGRVIATGWNQPIGSHDPTAHAEIVALRQAASLLGNYRLVDCELYVSLEPCSMCAGAIQHARIRRLVWGAPDPKTGACGSVVDLMAEERLNHHCEVRGRVLVEDCATLLRNFFAARRRQRREGSSARQPMLGRRNLRTARLILEPIVPAHAELLWPILGDPTIYRHLEESPPPDAQWLLHHFETLSASSRLEGAAAWLHWAMRETESGEYLGLVRAHAHADGSASLQCLLAVAQWGRGLAVEACAAVLQELREMAGTRSVWALSSPEQTSLIRVLEKLGFAKASLADYPGDDARSISQAWRLAL